MVTVLLSGGLGNQVFQYAAAKALAARLGTSFQLDTYTFSKKTITTIRSYELDIFNISAPVTDTFKGKLVTRFYPLIQRYRPFFQRLGVFTDTYAILYHPSFEKMAGNITMLGYFQNEKYFEAIKDELRKDFTFRKPLTGKNQELSERLRTVQSIGIHIRRGDYLTNQSSVSNFITLDKDYYDKAVKLIMDEVENPEFFIFSEDFKWIKENLSFGNHPVTFVNWNKGKDSYIDMQLMSLCRHNVIANSSFSWWGAWLNANPKKIVIAPSVWFQDKQKNELLKDFYPVGWIMI